MSAARVNKRVSSSYRKGGGITATATRLIASASSSSIIPLLTLAIFAAVVVGPSAADDFDLRNKEGSKVCVGKICDDPSVFHYYTCCGQLYNDCCFRLQTWVIIVLIVVSVFFLASFVIGLIRCICCCDRN